ncbi:restriction of telomere capping protein 5 [Aspergillus steynii IBT 23096]|uniref:Restriction of telomere capping protein 5 n=1 Tax=Aspergillus steynii IBT 23096 TaxID=1392250 RepID=A0A2I2GNT8_9EURO|nr:restriction of telomere capping protein 5 [Aspergillus steynii IBT 23096]PLB54544.1 restriction of telomere capping protein 5 [Aspergillus steynii IBT 23096]
MGVGPSSENQGQTSSPEELSYILAERFATKCFTHLELTHFKDNFFTRAIDQGGMKYWNEKILSDFLGIPDSSDADCPLDAGPVIFRMVSYLGAFPFQNTLAPSVLTFEAMVKVVVLLTERYGKVLRRARKDRIRLLFGSLADVGRRDIDKPTADENLDENPDDNKNDDPFVKTYASGFSIDAPANDSYEEEDDDDLALAALESLDAIEVFRHDSRIDKAVYEARISVATFRRLLMLLLVISPLKSLQPVRMYTSDLSESRMESVRKEADNILSAFAQEESGGIGYKTFATTIAHCFPYLFDPLTPLFEHLLFSKNLNLSQKRASDDPTTTEPLEETPESPLPPPESVMLPGSFKSVIINPSIISHLSFFLPSTVSNANFFHDNMRLHPVFSTAEHGSSLTSFSHNVLTWQSGTLLLLEGVVTESPEQENTVLLGAYLPQPWKSSSSHPSKSSDSPALPCLFQLSHKHLILPGNPSPSVQKPNMPTAYFSSTAGIAIGCQIPPSSRTQPHPPSPHGAGSLTIDASLETATFYVSPVGHNGVFLPPATLSPAETTTTAKTHIDIYNLEIWGLVPDPAAASSEQGQSAVELQQAKWEFEAREAERRRNLNLKAGAGDSAAESARWLLETAGLIGDGTGRQGGSV